jgi:hypothetical protein
MPQDTGFRASCRTFGLAFVGLKQATAAQPSGSKLHPHGAVFGLKILLFRIMAAGLGLLGSVGMRISPCFFPCEMFLSSDYL